MTVRVQFTQKDLESIVRAHVTKLFPQGRVSNYVSFTHFGGGGPQDPASTTASIEVEAEAGEIAKVFPDTIPR